MKVEGVHVIRSAEEKLHGHKADSELKRIWPGSDLLEGFIMRPKAFNTLLGTRSLSIKATLLASTAIIGISLNFGAIAQIPPVTEPYADGCPADSVGQTLNCTADDVSVALVTAEDANTRCLTGHTAVLNLDTVFEINASSERDDVAAWIPTYAELGKNMLLTSASGGPEFCISRAFNFPINADPDGTGPLVVDNLDGDACGDVNGTKDSFTRAFTDAEVACEGSVGGAEVDALVSWHLSGNDPVCMEHKDYGGFKKSKCSYTTSFVDLVVVGRLEVCKAAAEGTDEEFTFYVETGLLWVAGTGADLDPVVADSPFYLNPIDGPGGVVCESFDVLTTQGEVTNEVMIFEGVQEGSDFNVSDISCVNNTPGGDPAMFEILPDGFSIMLTEGNLGTVEGTDAGLGDVTGTITNTEGGSLTIIKEAIPNSTQAFSFSGEWNFSLDDDGNGGLPKSATFDNLDGTYDVIEAPVAGWTLTDVACENEEGDHPFLRDGIGIRVDVANGQNVSCTFTNVQDGMAIVRKEVLPALDTTEFEFTGNVSGFISGGLELSLVIPVPPVEGYTSTELVPVGWDLVSIECDDNNSSGAGDTATFNVEPGEVVTCVFTNVKQGSIVVEKEAIGGDDEFFFNNSWSDTFSIITSGGTGSLASNNLSASDEVIETTYSVVEITDEFDLSRWNYDGVVCTGADESVEDNTAIDLEPGETVTCVFTNTKWSSMTLIKEAYGPDDEFCFMIYSPVDDPFVECIRTEQGSVETGEDNLPLGTWGIEELLDEDGIWILASAECDNGDDPSAIQLDAGENITCTFINVLPNPIPVNNTLALMLMVLMMLAAGWYFRPAGMRKS